MLWVLSSKSLICFFWKGKDLVAAEVTTAVLVCVSAVVSTNSGGDDDLNDGNLVYDTVLGVGRGRDSLVTRDSINDVSKRSDGRCGGVVAVVSAGAGLDHGGRALNVVDGDTTSAHGASRGVGLSGHRGNRGQSRSDGLLVVLVSSLKGCGILGSVLNGDVTAETVGRTSAVIDREDLGHGLDLAGGLLRFSLEGTGEDWAVLNATRGVGAGGDGGLEGVDVPSVDEISVVSVTYLALVVNRHRNIGFTYQLGHRWTTRTDRGSP